MTSANHIHPRRRSPRGPGQALPDSTLKPCLPHGSLLRKGATFHSPSSPSSPVDPTLDIRSLPHRSLTSPQGLEDLIAASEKRVADIIDVFDRSFSISSDTNSGLLHKDVLPVPRAILAHAAANTPFPDTDENKSVRQPKSKKFQGDTSKLVATHTNHRHGSDSGLGSSVDTSVDDQATQTQHNRRGTSLRSASSVYTSLTGSSAINKSFSSEASSEENRFLDDYATKTIKKHIVDPILAEDALEEYHPLIGELPHRIAKRNITCLRDIEKTLIFLAPYKASSPASYLKFCITAIQCIHTTVDHLNDLDQRRPTDRPYTNNYFVDLVEQIRQYARIMAVTRQKKAKGELLDEMDYTPFVTSQSNDLHVERLLTLIRDEKLQLRGAGGDGSKPVELVRERNGKDITIQGGLTISNGDSSYDDTLLDDDVKRSMARKRKCDQGKVEYRSCRECGTVFTRACDLTKHEKTHSRPWKCPQEDCKYHEDGWPTEKERDRHVNDKHSVEAPLFRCLYEPCAYSSKRESNCKQHMEKAHGWEYVRAKNKKGTKLVATTKLASTSLPTPASGKAFPSLSTPGSSTFNSPATAVDHDVSPTSSGDAFGGAEEIFRLSPFTTRGSSIRGGSSTGVNMDLQYNGFSPFGSEDCPDLLNTPGTGSSALEFDFNFTDSLVNNNDWSHMEPYFPQYFQQPTPAMSDLDYNMIRFGEGKQEQQSLEYQSNIPATLTPAEPALCGEQEQLDFDEGFGDHSAPADWPLYSEPAPIGGESGAAGAAWFPELGLDAMGGQFGIQEETIYDEVDVPMTATEEFGMEQFLNWDNDAGVD